MNLFTRELLTSKAQVNYFGSKLFIIHYFITKSQL